MTRFRTLRTQLALAVSGLLTVVLVGAGAAVALLAGGRVDAVYAVHVVVVLLLAAVAFGGSTRGLRGGGGPEQPAAEKGARVTADEPEGEEQRDRRSRDECTHGRSRLSVRRDAANRTKAPIMPTKKSAFHLIEGP